MIKLLSCRRSIVAMLSIACLTSIAILKGIDTSSAIAAVAMGVAGANAFQGSKTPSPPGGE